MMPTCFGFLLYLAAVAFIVPTAEGRTFEQDAAARRLLDQLIRDYFKTLPPVRDDDNDVTTTRSPDPWSTSYPGDKPVKVEMSYNLNAITDLSTNGYLETTGYLNFRWTDPRLMWDPSDFSGLTSIKMHQDSIWVPDIEITNLAKDGLKVLTSPTSRLVTVDNIGAVFLAYSVTAQTLCDVIGQISTKSVACDIKFNSWTHNGFDLDLHMLEGSLHNFQFANIWNVTSLSVNRNVIYYSCCPEPFPDVTMNIVIGGRQMNAN